MGLSPLKKVTSKFGEEKLKGSLNVAEILVNY
jgi:hypothetical protein